MAFSDSDDYTDDEDDSCYSDYDDDDDDDDEGSDEYDDCSDDNDEEGSDEYEDDSDSEYSEDDDDEEGEEEEDKEGEKDADEQVKESEVVDEGREATVKSETEVDLDDNENEEDDEKDVPALEHAPREPDEISQKADEPFAGPSTPDIATGKGTDSSSTESAAANGNNLEEVPHGGNPSDTAKVNDSSEIPAEISPKATIGEGSAVDRKDR